MVPPKRNSRFSSTTHVIWVIFGPAVAGTGVVLGAGARAGLRVGIRGAAVDADAIPGGFGGRTACI